MNKPSLKLNKSLFLKTILFAALVAFGCVLLPSMAWAENKFTNTFLFRVGADFTAQDVADVYKFDLIAVQGFRWASVNGDTWGELKRLNPNIGIFSYYQSRIMNSEDHKTNPYKSSMGRWNVSRGHSMGNLNTDNPDLFLLDKNGDRVQSSANNTIFIPDYGDSRYRRYWIEAWTTDNIGKEWLSDGVFIDEAQVLPAGIAASPQGIEWPKAMREYYNEVSKKLAEHNQLVWGNSGVVKAQEDIDAYIALDNIENPIFLGASEGAFVVGWGSGDCQFFSESIWLKQIEICSQIHRMNYGIQSFVDHESNFEPGQIGTDNWGESVTIMDALGYGLCSYHLGKNTIDNNTYFSFNAANYSYATYHDEYDIDLGNAVDTFKVVNISGNNIYYREFERGYVYVNPTRNNVSTISLPETCKQLTHNNFKDDPATISDVNTINLISHRGTMLLKSDLSAPTSSYGDVNQDNQVNIQDIQACVNHILGAYDYGVAANVNKDGSVDILDVQIITNTILTFRSLL
ncbi:hypothetical protein KAR34_10205 [bacterium]|nr:hypothetical protein [bacterium]